MGKFQFDSKKRIEKFSASEKEDLVLDLVHAVVMVQSVKDVALFLQDLLTKSELRMLSKRLRIAKLLLQGLTYEQIEDKLHTSHTTVAKIAAWLSEKGEGFRAIVQKLPKKQNIKEWHNYSEWDKIKRRYSLYFWPELLLEEILKSATP